MISKKNNNKVGNASLNAVNAVLPSETIIHPCFGSKPQDLDISFPFSLLFLNIKTRPLPLPLT